MSAACRCISAAQIGPRASRYTPALIVTRTLFHPRFSRVSLFPRRSSLISPSRLTVSYRPLCSRPSTARHRKVSVFSSLRPHERSFGDHCALHRPIIPMQAEFKEVNSGANVFTPFYLNPRGFRMYCQFCIYTPRAPASMNKFIPRFRFRSRLSRRVRFLSLSSRVRALLRRALLILLSADLCATTNAGVSNLPAKYPSYSRPVSRTRGDLDKGGRGARASLLRAHRRMCAAIIG